MASRAEEDGNDPGAYRGGCVCLRSWQDNKQKDIHTHALNDEGVVCRFLSEEARRRQRSKHLEVMLNLASSSYTVTAHTQGRGWASTASEKARQI